MNSNTIVCLDCGKEGRAGKTTPIVCDCGSYRVRWKEKRDVLIQSPHVAWAGEKPAPHPMGQRGAHDA